MNRTPIGWTHGLETDCPNCAQVQARFPNIGRGEAAENCARCGTTSRIERVGYTWNPLRGCSRVSPGCVHCYAETMAARFSGPGLWAEGYAKRVGGKARWTGKVDLVPEKLADPLRTKAPGLIFANSMSDMFHESLSNEEIAAIFGIMAASHWHIFQCLTKRAKRMREWFEWLASVSGQQSDICVLAAQRALPLEELSKFSKHLMDEITGRYPWPLPNVWLGVSAEDQERWDERVPELLRCPAAVHFVSAEPLLGPVNVWGWCEGCGTMVREFCRGIGGLVHERDESDWEGLCGPVLRPDQIIVGAESGRGARPMQTEWAASIVGQCAGAGCACYVKQFATPAGRKITEPAKMPGSGPWPQELPS